MLILNRRRIPPHCSKRQALRSAWHPFVRLLHYPESPGRRLSGRDGPKRRLADRLDEAKPAIRAARGNPVAAEATEIPQCSSLSGSPHRLSAVLFSPRTAPWHGRVK